MFDQIVPGLMGESSTIITEQNTARHLGSGEVSVFATPEMIRLMERAAVDAVDHLFPEGYRTVGVHVDVRHLAATPLGMRVRARATLKDVSERLLTFEVKAWDDVELTGSGTHRRAIIDVEGFRRRAEGKSRG